MRKKSGIEPIFKNSWSKYAGEDESSEDEYPK